MQGRLLPKYKNRYQAHPKNSWKKEFLIAKELGFECIEFIFDYDDWDINPLLTVQGLKEISEITKHTNVKVLSICADYFMEQPIFFSNLRKKNLRVLSVLAHNCEKIGVKDIVIPFVDNSSLLENPLRIKETISFFKELLTQNKFTLNFTLETDLPPKQFRNLIESIDHKLIKINYDIGNSASLGYNFYEELDLYQEFITNIHIKDRLSGGGSIKLGEGAANFPDFFKTLKKYHFRGIFILQAFRDKNAIASINPQLIYIKELLSK
jgi:L-ribulose-5-phosphate 3-epimerase